MPRTPIHPGEHVLEEMETLNLSVEAFAEKLGVEPDALQAVLQAHSPLDADMALRLGHFFGNGPRLWMNLQMLYELRLAEAQLGDALQFLPALKPPIAA